MPKKPPRPPKKNLAALALSRLATKSLTPEQRSARARLAVQARWRNDRKAKGVPEPEPPVFWGLFQIEDLNEADCIARNPKLLAWAQSKAELYARSKLEFADTLCMVEPLDYDPRRVQLVSDFQPNVKRQLDALRILAGTRGKR